MTAMMTEDKEKLRYFVKRWSIRQILIALVELINDEATRIKEVYDDDIEYANMLTDAGQIVFFLNGTKFKTDNVDAKAQQSDAKAQQLKQ